MLLKPIRTKKSDKSAHPVSIHACERYAERIMELGDMEDKLTFVQIEGITNMILRILNEEHPQNIHFKNGSFTCKNHDCVLVMKDRVIVTVKYIEPLDDLRFKDSDEWEDPWIKGKQKIYRKGKQVFKKGYK